MRRPNALGMAAWPGLIATVAARADAVAQGLAATIRDEFWHVVRPWPAGLPEGVIHADLFPENLLLDAERAPGVIDFYFACHDAPAYDLAIGLNAWCFGADGCFVPEWGQALLAGYEAVRPFEPAERNTLPILCRGVALRFLLTRLVDWFATSVGALVTTKAPLEYLGKLRFHGTVSRAADYRDATLLPPREA